MRLLLDGCVLRSFGRALPEHAVEHVSELGWDDLDDGPLLDRMADQFDALITTDKSLPYQQRLAHRAFGVLILRAPTNRLQDLLPLVPQVRAALPGLRPGEARVLGA